MPLGINLSLGPGHIVLDREGPSYPQRSTAALPQFSAHVYGGQTAGWIKIPLGMELVPRPRRHSVRRSHFSDKRLGNVVVRIRVRVREVLLAMSVCSKLLRTTSLN